MKTCRYGEANDKVWALVLVTILVGMATGFSAPLLAAYKPSQVFEPAGLERAGESATEILPAQAEPSPYQAEPSLYDVERDSELQALAARNRRLEALVATLRKEKAAEAEKAAKNDRPLDELGTSQ